MHPDLDTLKNELPPYLESRGLVIFHGESRLSDDSSVVMWDVEKRPDFREFVECSQRLGVKVIVIHAREFEKQALDDVKDELADCEMPQPERREFERRLKKLQPYTGFTSQIEISFDYEGLVYMYEARSEFMNELLTIMNDVDLWLPVGEEGEEEDPMAADFSLAIEAGAVGAAGPARGRSGGAGGSVGAADAGGAGAVEARHSKRGGW